MSSINSENSSQPQVYLASKSPRRRELLSQIGVPFEPLAVEVAEQRSDGESAEDYVTRLAREKAEAGAILMQERGLIVRPVVGADTLVVCDGIILEKPRDAAHATQMLTQLSGRSHEVLTAVSLCDGNQQQSRLASTRVNFRPLSDEEIRRYWHTGEPRDKAGAYAIQGLGAVFVDSIEGSYSNVVGLPIEQLVILLRAFDIGVWNLG